MTTRTMLLTEEDHRNWDAWIIRVFDAYKTGKLDQVKTLATIGQVIGALDRGNIGEVRAWIEGRNPIDK